MYQVLEDNTSAVSTTTFSGCIGAINSFRKFQMVAVAELSIANGISSVSNEKVLSSLLSLLEKYLT